MTDWSYLTPEQKEAFGATMGDCDARARTQGGRSDPRGRA